MMVGVIQELQKTLQTELKLGLQWNTPGTVQGHQERWQTSVQHHAACMQ